MGGLHHWNGRLGLVLIGLFILTGQYLSRVEIPPGHEEGLYRMMLRANHMYLLYVGLANILMGSCRFQNKIYQNLSSSLFLISGFTVVLAFILETDGHLENRIFSFITAINALIGIGFVVLDRYGVPKKIPAQKPSKVLSKWND